MCCSASRLVSRTSSSSRALGQLHELLLRRRVDGGHARARFAAQSTSSRGEVAGVRAHLHDRARAGGVEARDQQLRVVDERVGPAPWIVCVGVDLHTNAQPAEQCRPDVLPYRVAAMGRKVLVTGGAGFVGGNLAVTLAARHPDWDLVAFDNLSRRGSELNLPAPSRGRRRVRPGRRASAIRAAAAGSDRCHRRVLCGALRAAGRRRRHGYVFETNLVGPTTASSLPGVTELSSCSSPRAASIHTRRSTAPATPRPRPASSWCPTRSYPGFRRTASPRASRSTARARSTVPRSWRRSY